MVKSSPMRTKRRKSQKARTPSQLDCHPWTTISIGSFLQFSKFVHPMEESNRGKKSMNFFYHLELIHSLMTGVGLILSILERRWQVDAGKIFREANKFFPSDSYNTDSVIPKSLVERDKEDKEDKEENLLKLPCLPCLPHLRSLTRSAFINTESMLWKLSGT